jgi:hypothetical protein
MRGIVASLESPSMDSAHPSNALALPAGVRRAEKSKKQPLV